MTTLTIKKSVIALGISLALSSTAMANSVVLSQTGDDNLATLTQVGLGNSIGAAQVGVENDLDSTQAGLGSSLIALQDGYQNEAVTWQEGDGNSLELTQLGDGGNFIDYFAQGNDNYSRLHQEGANTIEVESYGDLNGLFGTQFGEDNLISLYTDGYDNGVDATQSGNDNLAQYNIDGADGSYIYSWQSGQSNEAFVDIFARNSGAISTNNSVAIVQDGNDNLTDISLRGDGNYVRSEQRGYDNTMTLTQPAHFGTNVDSLQEGVNNDLSVHIGASSNGLSSHQWGDDNTAEVLFTGRRNYGESTQYGELNSLNLLVSNQYNSFSMGQYGDNNVISGIGGGAFEIGGDGGSVSLVQVGSANLIQGHQLSDASSMNIVQNGSMNSAIVTQQ